jgi:hypothetical protein
MCTDSLRALWAGLPLALVLLSAGCVSLSPPPSQEMNLRYIPPEASVPAPAQASGIEPPHGFSSSPHSVSEPETPQRLHRRRASREAVTAAGPDRAERDARQGALAAQLAFLRAVGEVSGSTRRLSAGLSRLKTRGRGISGKLSDIFVPYVDDGERQLRWMDTELAAATRLAHAASQVEDPDMRLALLRLAGPRLEAAMMGSLLLSGWLDLLQLTDAILSDCPYYSLERLIVQVDGWHMQLEPSMAALSSLEPGQVDAAASDLPALVGHLSDEFAATQQAVRVAAENFQKMVVLKESVEALTMLLAMRPTLPSLPPSAPALLGVGLVVGGDSVMMGTRIVVSAEWVEMVRRLVRVGVISLPVVSAAVRIRAGQMLMAQAHGELPRGVREALGDGPEVRAMHERGRAGAGMAEPRGTTSCHRSSASGSSSAASAARWTSTSSASRWSRQATKPSMAVATGASVAGGPANGTG